jgi:hypothetical protein
MAIASNGYRSANCDIISKEIASRVGRLCGLMPLGSWLIVVLGQMAGRCVTLKE